MEKMFCFQCEQTAGGKGCVGRSGVCGKKDQTSNLQDELVGALVTLARAAEGKKRTVGTDNLMLRGLFTTVTNVSFDDQSLNALIDDVHAETDKYQRGHAFGFDMASVWDANEDVRSLKSLILFGLKGIAAYAYHAHCLGYKNEEVLDFFFIAMRAVGADTPADELLRLTLETGRINLLCMELLDKANTDSYGTPVPTTVPLTIEKGPFIVVSGHDLHDLHLLLEQTKGKGINIYTHSEMLPAHGYPKLKAYPHLKGNFGTAWQNQQKEFENIPAPVLFTTNCLMPVRDSYRDRIFTTAVVQYPGMVHIGAAGGNDSREQNAHCGGGCSTCGCGGNGGIGSDGGISGDGGGHEQKDFSPVIAKALELGGYPDDHAMTGINGGTTVTTGFGHGTVLSVAGTVIDAVKSGAIKHFFLVGGCDGAQPGRNYYTDFVKKTPSDTIILTLACGKYRFNDLDLGTIGGLPRILDMGQCNDAFSAIKVAVALAEAFGCGVNELPLSMVLSWYEQKAVAILLTLLHLGIKNILIGPSLPAFLSPAVLDVLVKNYNLTPITTPEDDLKKILGK